MPSSRAESPAHRDAAATKRSYLFVAAISVTAGVVLTAIVVAAVGHAGSHRDAVIAAVVLAAALFGWLAFLRGLCRRDLGRIDGLDSPAENRYDPRSK